MFIMVIFLDYSGAYHVYMWCMCIQNEFNYEWNYVSNGYY